MTEPYVPAHLLGNREHFCRMLRIKREQGHQLAPFELSAAQRRFLELMEQSGWETHQLRRVVHGAQGEG